MMTAPVTTDQLAVQIAAERREMADILAGLPAGAWDSQTLCAGWRVRELIAHTTMPFRYSPARFAIEMIRSGGKFNHMADRVAKRDAAIPAAALVSVLRQNAANPWRPPGAGLRGALVHDVIHGLDITVPLGIDRSMPAERLRIVLDAMTESKSLAFFGTDLGDVELQADDLDWSFGTGRRVSGAAQDLALVLCGRKLPAGRLSGAPTQHFSPHQPA
jgi:uncharacterized protein (TIGR03083 family)